MIARFKLTLLIAALFFPLVHSQSVYNAIDPSKKLTQLIQENYTIEDGLPTNSLRFVFRDSGGYLWISSYSGLIRFDGFTFQNFNFHNTEVFKTNIVERITEDSRGRIWCATEASGLICYDNGSFRSYGSSAGVEHLYRAIYIDENDVIYAASPDIGWFSMEDDSFRFFEADHSLENIEVQSITKTADGSIWFATYIAGLYRWKEGEFTVYDEGDGLPSNWLHALYVDNKDVLWIGTSEGLCSFTDGEFTRYPVTNRYDVSAITQDAAGSLWIGTENGLFRKNPETGLFRKNPETGNFDFIDSGTGLFQDHINDIYADVEGILWISNHRGGLSKLKDGMFVSYSEAEGLIGKIVNTICEYEEGVLLVGLDNGIINKIENENISQFNTNMNLKGKRIRDIMKDSNDNLYISTYSGLLIKAADGEERWLHQGNGFPGTKIRLSYEDSKGRIWIGTRNNGLIRSYDDGSYMVFNKSNGLDENLILAIDEDEMGNILVGTANGGMSVITGDSISKTYRKKDGFISDIIFNIYRDKNDVLWIAAHGGIARIDQGQITNFTIRDGLLNDSPYDIIEDDLGNFWLPCNNGVMRVHKNEFNNFARGIVDTINCMLYGKQDGMKQPECNSTTQSLRASDGKMWFPTIDGVVHIDPDRIYINRHVPEVVLEKFVVDYKSRNLSLPIDIEPGSRRYTFYYSALSLYAPSGITFRYKLLGVDEDWIDAGNQRSISYTNLPYGDYTFRVIASNNDGIWNMKGAALNFTINPFFYETFWFYLFSAVLLLSVVFLVVRYRISSLKRRQKELEETVNLRTEEIVEHNKLLAKQKEEIHRQAEDLKQAYNKLKELNSFKEGMTSMIVHDLKNPISTILNTDMSLYDQTKINKIKNSGNQMLNLVLNILDVNKFEDAKMELQYEKAVLRKLADEAIEQNEYQSDHKSLQINNLIVPGAEITIDRELIKRVFINLFSNAVKFSPVNGVIEIKAKCIDNSMVEVCVTDSGPGISEKDQALIFQKFSQVEARSSAKVRSTGLGLTFCKLAVEAHGGNIGVRSKPGEGAAFHFTLPVKNCTGNFDSGKNNNTKENELTLTADAKKLLKPYADELNMLALYEISAIRAVLKSLPESDTEIIYKWREEVRKAALNSNELLFRKLTNL